MTTIIARSSEQTHWYGQDGSPQYTVKAKDGSDRPTTLRDARKFDLVPSVTTIMKVMAKPGLDVWKNEQLLLAALTLPKVDGESEKAFIARVVADSKETGKRAAEQGTLIHESIERFYAGESNVKHMESAQAFKTAVEARFGSMAMIPEASFSSPKGYGGKVDLYAKKCAALPEGLVLDSKTKDFGPDDDIVAYDENLMQLAAYRMGLDLPHAKCANVFVSRTHPGLVRIHEWSEEELVRGYRMFGALLTFWKLKNKFGE